MCVHVCLCVCGVSGTADFREGLLADGQGLTHTVNQHTQSSTHAHTDTHSTPNQTWCRHAVLAKLDYVGVCVGSVLCVRQQMVMICLPVCM